MKILVAMLGSVFAIGAAEAQTPHESPDGPADAHVAAPHGTRNETSEDRKVEEHINKLRQELKITADEEADWDNVAKTMRENAKDLDRVIDKREAGLGTATAVEDLNSYADVAQAHAAAVKRLADTFSSLYAEMSDTQKKTADHIFSHRHHDRTDAKT
jgi:hypothetical protein